MSLYLLVNDWWNLGAYPEDYHEGTQVIGVFTSRNLAMTAAKSFYESDLQLSKIKDDAIKDDTNVYDYFETEDGIQWIFSRGHDIDSIQYNFVIKEIQPNDILDDSLPRI